MKQWKQQYKIKPSYPQKEFHKVRHGVNEVQNYTDCFNVFHNFVRKGVKDKMTPAERCGIGIKGCSCVFQNKTEISTPFDK